SREMLGELTRIAQKLDPVTPPDVGGWARLVVEEVLPAPPRRTGTMSAEPQDPATMMKPTKTFVVHNNVDGITVLEVEPPPVERPRAWRISAIVGLALGVALFVGGAATRRLTRAT